MGTLATIPGLAGGMATGAKNLGVPVLGSAGRNQLSPPISGAAGVQTGVIPGAPPASVTGVPPIQGPGMNTLPPPTALAANPTAGGGVANNGNPLAAGNAPTKLDSNITKQLTDIYGKGVGGALANVLQNLGSNDSSYIQAYQQAMSGQQAEDISTIGTSLGNAGISADSSTSAIEKADYMSRSTAQLGLQEQQLIQNQMQEQIGILQGTQEDAKAETSSSWLDTLGQVAGIAGTFVGDATGLSSIGQGIGSAAQYVTGMFKTPQNANINPGSIPGLQSYDPGLGV